ncbi:hypothetical protein GPALN_005879 [Globodera pallida]|nr:hypothetical protein GPALN_005879 [Globodera pallida]
MHLVANYHNNYGISSHKDLQQQLKNIGVELPLHTLGNYLNEIEILTRHPITVARCRISKTPQCRTHLCHPKLELILRIFFGGNSQNNDGDLESMIRKPSSLEGFVLSLVGASPQEPQFSPSMHDTSAALSYYPTNQPDDQTLESMIPPRNPSSMPYQQARPMQDTFVPSQPGTNSTNFFGGNLQNNDGDLESMIRKSSSSEGFYGTPFLPNQLQSTGWPGASNFFSPTPNTSNFTSGNPGSPSYYRDAVPYQQAPMPGTSSSIPSSAVQSISSIKFIH